MFFAVSILVSIWMHLEDKGGYAFDYAEFCFNPSFYMDASGSDSVDVYACEKVTFQS